MRWDAKQKRDSAQFIKLKTNLLCELQSREGPNDREEINKLDQEIALLLEMEDTKWKHRAKKSWFHIGDKNTKFFHACTSQRKEKHQIKQLKVENNQVVTSLAAINEAFVTYFQNVFTSSNPSQLAIEEFSMHVKSLVTKEMNLELTKPFCLAEIKMALN